MRITLPHYFDFGNDRELVGDDLVRPEAWDALRMCTSGPFALPRTRERWEQAANERDDIRERACAIDAWLKEHGVRDLASYGVGGASLELWLFRLQPGRRLVLTDYAPATVERLRALFPEVDVRRHDLFVDDPLDATVHLFHRIDTELTNAEWQEVFRRFAARPVLLVATDVADLKRVVYELRALRHNRRCSTRAGLLRTAAAFEWLWRSTHRSERLRFRDLDAWYLEPRR